MNDSPYKIVNNTGDRRIRRIERDGMPVALIMLYANGRWGVFDTDGNAQVVRGSFDTPKEALAAYASANTINETEG